MLELIMSHDVLDAQLHVIKLMTQFTVNDRNMEATLFTVSVVRTTMPWFSVSFSFFPSWRTRKCCNKMLHMSFLLRTNYIILSLVHWMRSFALPCVTFTSKLWIYMLRSTSASFFLFSVHLFFILLDKISNLDNIMMASDSTRAISRVKRRRRRRKHDKQTKN